MIRTMNVINSIQDSIDVKVRVEEGLYRIRYGYSALAAMANADITLKVVCLANGFSASLFKLGNVDTTDGFVLLLDHEVTLTMKLNAATDRGWVSLQQLEVGGGG